MKRQDFLAAVESVKTATHDALAEVWSELNNGQKKKLLKNEKIAELLRRYGVIEAD